MPIGFIFRYDTDKIPYWLRKAEITGYKDNAFSMANSAVLRKDHDCATPELRDGPAVLLRMVARLRDGPHLTERTLRPEPFTLPPGVAAEHATELQTLMENVSACSRFSETREERDSGAFAEYMRETRTSCDFTLNAEIKFAMDVSEVSESRNFCWQPPPLERVASIQSQQSWRVSTARVRTRAQSVSPQP